MENKTLHLLTVKSLLATFADIIENKMDDESFSSEHSKERIEQVDKFIKDMKPMIDYIESEVINYGNSNK